MAASLGDLLHENGSAADSDADSDVAGPDGYYRPISAYDDRSASDSDDDGGGFGVSFPVRSNGGSGPIHGQNSNPGFFQIHMVNGVSGLDLNGDGEGGGMEEDDHNDEEEEEERAREREASISRAFREDESRRSAPLTPENAARIVDAMRGVSFQGIPPDWVNRVPEDQWVNQLRGLRGEATPQN
ncbi:uncharacterized protein LOC103720210 [Phoenix dactylifera]|uniref:Uncharacterized protein LOC103720210 n=1 Tax=Phoenix dactylifera TaxID=42345 RepID=A0A8B7CWR7_PHODC|nr:uncharacterized protein LOC103720210 [Phoenix dactylifera]